MASGRTSRTARLTPTRRIRAFVSPNISTGSLNLAEAEHQLQSPRQQALKEASAYIDEQLGIPSSTTDNVIGAWSDGAENSMMMTMRGTDYETARIASAMKGHLAQQKAVIVFQPNEPGTPPSGHFMASWDVDDDATTAHGKLEQNGVTFHTLQPLEGGGTRIFVYGEDQESYDSVGRAAAAYQSKFEVVYGAGEFLGTTKEDGTDAEQRADAQRVYEEAIGSAAGSGGRDVGAIWKDVRDHWRTAFGSKTEGSEPGKEPGGAAAAEPGKAAAAEAVEPAEAEAIYKRAAEAQSPAVDLFDQVVGKEGIPTPEALLATFPEDVRAKIAEAEQKIANGKQTIEVYKQSDGTYVPDRQKLHGDILKKIFTPGAVVAARPKPGQKPSAVLAGGRGGSGKSWLWSKDGPVKKDNYIYINSDDIKEMLPEYEGWNAGLLHEEASDIVHRINEIARRLGLNVIQDATLKTEKSARKLHDQYVEDGYDVSGYYVFASPKTAATRAVERFVKTGRFVPPAYTLGSLTNEVTFDSLKGDMVKWAVYSSNEGFPTKLVAESESKQRTK